MNTPHTYKFLPPRLFHRLHGLEITVRRPMDGTRQNQHRSTALGSSVEFAEYRDYMPGDPLERIDWAVYARSDHYVIRQSHEQVNARAYVLLDISRSMAFKGDGAMSKMDYASYLAAGMLYMLVKQRDSASLITFDSQIRDMFPLSGAATGLRAPLRHLEDIVPTEPGDIEKALHEVAGRLSGRSFIVLISDLLQDPQQVMRGLHHLHHEGKDITVFHVLDPAELTLGARGQAELNDMETGRRMRVDLDAVRPAYQQRVQRYLDALRRGCAGLRIDYVLSDTRTPHHEALRKRSVAT